MKMLTKLMTGLVAMLLVGAAMADTFYLQASMPTNPDYPGQTDYTRWYDAPVGGTQMASNTPFFGNFFNPNGFSMKTSYTLSEGVLDTDVFPGTIVVDTAATYVYGNYVKTNYIAGIDWSLIGSRDASFRNHQWNDAVVTITNLNVTGLMVFRANNLELNMDLHAPSLTGGGTLQFGTDPEEGTGIWGLDVDNSAFTGTISIAVGNLKIIDTLMLNNANLSVVSLDCGVILSSNATFLSANYGPDVIPAGVYTAAELNSELGTGNFSGSGTLTVLTDNIQTFYLQAARTRVSDGGNTLYYENAKQWWWDDPVAGNNMTNVVGAAFAGNRFELNGYSYNTWDGSSTGVPGKFTFGGTLVKGNETITKWAMPTWVLAGLHVTSNSVTASNGIRFRDSNGAMTVESFRLDGLLTIQANDLEKNFDLSIVSLKGAGELRFGDDDTLAEDGGSTWKLDIDNSSFAGTIRARVGDLEFADTIELPDATLLVDAGSTFVGVVLSNDVTFGAVNYGATSVPDGEYTADELNTILGVIRFSGLGTLQVGVLSPAQAFDAWLAQYPTLGSLTNLLDDAEEPVPDGMNNLLEYALGGDPTNDDAAAVLPVSSTGAGWLNLVYDRRVDAAALGLTYTVVTDTDLVSGAMTNEVPEYGASTIAVDGFVTATNRISTATDSQAFMQLKVEINQ